PGRGEPRLTFHPDQRPPAGRPSHITSCRGRFAMRVLLGLLGFALCLTTSARAADVKDLIKNLKDKDTDVRRRAAGQLKDLGSDAKPAAEALILAVKDEALYVRRFAVQALGAIGPDVKGVVPALAGALKDSERRVVEAAAGALGGMGSAAVQPLLGLLR